MFELEFGLGSTVWVFAVILRWDLQSLFKCIHPVLQTCPESVFMVCCGGWGSAEVPVCCGEVTPGCPIAPWLPTLSDLCCTEHGWLVEIRLSFVFAGFGSHPISGNQHTTEIRCPWFIFF